MKEYKLSTSYYIFIVFFVAAGVLGLYAGFHMLIDNTDANGGEEGILLSVAFLILGTLYIIAGFTMLLQAIYYKGIGLKISKEGIGETLVFMNIFAFYFVMPVKFIPWDAVVKLGTEKGYIMADIDASKVTAGSISKILLKLAGYGFCMSFVKPKVTREDIDAFRMC